MIFIISWSGQHKSACLIAEQISKKYKNVYIVYSDPDPDFVLEAQCHVIKRPNELFWADKFKACLDASGTEGMLVIHADCQCKDWLMLVERCKQVTEKNKNIAVWAPKIDGTYWHVDVTQILKIKKYNIILSSFTDGIVFYLAPNVIDRMRRVDYDKNEFGWGIDLLFCSYAHMMKKYVVTDLMVEVEHPKEITGYDIDKALSGKKIFLQQFSMQERITYELLNSHVRYNYIKRRIQERGAQQR